MGGIMKGHWKKASQVAVIAILVVLMLSLFLPAPAPAQGLAMSGNFYRQHFELIPGET
jgi:accessory gene regulator protein AgrB